MRLFVAIIDFSEGSRDSILNLDKSHFNPKTFIAINDLVTMLLLRYSAFYETIDMLRSESRSVVCNYAKTIKT